MARRNNFSEDEKINMLLRRQAGETVESIADDYSCSVFTIRYHTEPSFRTRCLNRNIKAVHAYRRRRRCPAS